jgi:type II secretory pathway pseudopilin PulG
MGRQKLEAGIAMKIFSSKGFSLAETVIALGVLTTGVLGAAAVLTTGVKNLSSSPGDVVVTQKATQAIEAVFSARDSHKLTWAQIRNVHGASGNDGGIFLDGPQPLYFEGLDGLVNTADDAAAGIESTVLPGKDQMIGGIYSADDVTVTLTNYTREIQIRDYPNENGELRTITVTVTYTSGTTVRKYVLTTFISAYS